LDLLLDLEIDVSWHARLDCVGVVGFVLGSYPGRNKHLKWLLQFEQIDVVLIASSAAAVRLLSAVFTRNSRLFTFGHERGWQVASKISSISR